ncbi:GGDEF domain-containing protein [Sulfurospirillum sp. 1612]|uniref:GGDEF domain-containing protein n=1 Tax=Sulfurospirillum sp. 1612 TaxID=3094835 RepID=UPI002F94B771
MRGNKKILAIFAGILLSFSLLIIAIVVVSFKSYVQKREFVQAKIVASMVEGGLTAHMNAGVMSQRQLFLENAKKSADALDIWIFRTDKVVQEFGKGFPNETVRDAIDKTMIKTKKIQEVIHDDLLNPTLRITIPYIATAHSHPDCLSCHTNAKEGDVLGGISMVFSLQQARYNSIMTILRIFGISILFIILFIFVTSKLLKPYVGSLIYIKESLEKANKGDYSTRIKLMGDNESTEAFKWLNTLLEKLQEMVGSIDKNIALFVSDRRQTFQDPLEKSKFIIEDIAMLYRFKKVIEQDISKQIIYQRLVKFFKEHLKIENLSFYEVDIKKDTRTLIYEDITEDFCHASINTSVNCRAFRTNSIVASDDFESVCQACKLKRDYLCINYPIDENISLVINIKPKDSDALFQSKKAIGYIKNYLESARPVLQSKILTEILQKSNMIDGLTGLHNRKYLDIFMETRVLEYKSYAIAMLDIDYFKKVNDSYGHDAGDRVLRGLSEIFKKTIKKEDVAFRFGGEEFLIFMPTSKDAYETIKKIKDMFEKTIFEMGETSLNKTLSAGISYYKEDAPSAWQVIKNADIALYDAKHSGRNKIVLFKDIKEKDQ